MIREKGTFVSRFKVLFWYWQPMGSQKKMAKSSESYITSSSEWAGLGSDRKRTEQLFGKQYRMKIVGNNSNDIKRKFKLISPLISVSHIFYLKIQKEFVNFYTL